MPQALVREAVCGFENRDYPAGKVVSFPADALEWLKSRKLVDDTPSVVAAAIAGGAERLKHRHGSQLRQTAMSSLIGGIVFAALFGDSNTASMFNRGGTTIETQAHGWGTWLESYSMQRVQVLWNEATGGQEILPDYGQKNSLSVQITGFLASYTSRIVNRCIIMMATNDSDMAPSAVAAEYLNQLKRLGAYQVTLVTVPPPGTGAASVTTYDGFTVRGQWVLQFNALIKQMARDYPHWITVVDGHAIGVDPASAIGQAKAGMLYDDATVGLHLNNLYAQRLGKAVSDSICVGLPPQFDWITSAGDIRSLVSSSAVEKPLNVHTNPLFLSGSPVGTGYTDSVNAGLTHVPSIVDHPNGFGKCQQLAVTATAQAGFSRLTGSSFSGQLSPGDSVWSQMWIRIPPNSGICAPRLVMTVIMDGVTYYRTSFANVMTNAAQVDGCDLLVRTPTLDIPEGANITTASLQLTNFAYAAGVADSPILVGQVEARKLSDAI